MSIIELKTTTENLANEIGNSLIERLKSYLKDEKDTDFLKEMAVDIAQLQFQAATAATDVERERAKEDLKFTYARVQTFVARNAIKFRTEFDNFAQEIINTVVSVAGAFAGAAIKSALTNIG